MKTKISRTIVITGATKGLGRALADRFVTLGHTVIGCGRSSDAIADLQQTYPAPHSFSVVDVADDQQVGEWAKQHIEADCVPDLLLNNAALINQPNPLWAVPPSEFASMLQVNIQGVYAVIRHWLPAMMAQKRGVVVNFSSGWGRSTSPDVAPYCTTKWAIEGMTQALSQELPEGLAAVAYSPGVIDTEMLRTCFGESAGQHQSPAEWSAKAAETLLALTARDNGRSI